MTPPQSFTDLLPKTAHEPVFSEPWQAQAFALTVTVHKGGLFTWDEWANCLSEEIAADKAASGPDDGSNYYALWLATLERMVRDKGAASGDELATLKDAWQESYLSTPHGQPVPEPEE
ncbi:MAG: nitrile hydratase accessory protein [Rhodospirillaceae bacterium]|nr:nitrile hydratase accessory protein [Rhodospirillaceae bacterium]